MSRIVVLGAGPLGLATSMLLTDEGHDVVVLERDPQPCPASPEEAWESWDRHGVAQFRQAHYLHPGVRPLLETSFPDVVKTLESSGAVAFNALSLMPPSVTDRSPRPGDERFVTLTARRPVIEYAFASVAAPRQDVRRGVHVTALRCDSESAPGVPHVDGVRLATGEEIAADLVIDATGRRSKLPEWIRAIGGRAVVEEAQDYGFVYYTRFFRARGDVPTMRAPLNTPVGSISILTLPADSGTWSVTVYISSDDTLLKTLREADRWTAAVAACPRHAHWLDGEPLTDVLPMAGAADRRRSFVVDGTPVATGVLAIGDAWAATNPSLGRGITLGLKHVLVTAQALREHADDPLALARRHDELTNAQILPWYQNTVDVDRGRAAAIRAAIDGTPPPVSDDPRAVASRELAVAMLYDADVFRAFAEIMSLVTPPAEVMSRPGLGQRIHQVASDNEPPPYVGPSRADLLQIAGAA